VFRFEVGDLFCGVWEVGNKSNEPKIDPFVFEIPRSLDPRFFVRSQIEKRITRKER